MARRCLQCDKLFPDSQAFCTDDGSALPYPAGPTEVPAQALTDQGGPNTAPADYNSGFPTAPSSEAEPVDPVLYEGATVGEYVVERKIGEGGMGVIYSAKQPVIGKRVAIKVLNIDMGSNSAMVQRFIQEARSVNQIGHRNIVDIFSFARLVDGRHYFVMEHLEGMPLSRRIREPMEWQEGINIWLQMVSAIEAAHTRGIIHRDLKPDNIFCTPGGDGPFVKILDFGIAKLLGDSSVQKTGTGVPMGTPLYMSPEQTRGENVDHRTDIYAMGCIFYETIVGETPFNASSYIEVMTRQLTQAPPPIRERATVNVGLEALVLAMLAKESGARPQTMGAVRTELIRLRDLAIQHQQPLFIRRGDLVQNTPSPKAGVIEVTEQWAPPVDAGFTVPEPRDTAERRAVANALGGGGSGKIIGVVAGLAVVGALVGVVLHFTQRPTPTPPVTTPPVVVTPPVAPTMGRIKIIATESGISVTLDGKAVGQGGPVLQVEASAGRHELKVTRAGFLPYSNQIVVAAGETTDDVVKLVPEPAVPVPHVGKDGKHPKTEPAKKDPGVQTPRNKDDTINAFGN